MYGGADQIIKEMRKVAVYEPTSMQHHANAEKKRDRPPWLSQKFGERPASRFRRIVKSRWPGFK